MTREPSAASTGRAGLRLHADRFPGDPVLDTAVSHVMLRRVAAGRVGESLRLYTPEDALLFSSLDARRPGYARALELAVEAGFPPVIRLAGGQAAAFLVESIAFAWAMPDADAHLHIPERFEQLAGWIADSLRRIGLDARVGPVPGEYCPGEYSVNVAGRVKVMGVGQRVIRGGAHVGGVLTVGGTDRLRAVLGPVYDALGLEFRADTAGGVADFDAALDTDAVLAALREELVRSGRGLEPAVFDASCRQEAEALLPVHAPATSADLGEVLRASRWNEKALLHGDGRAARDAASDGGDS
jgi:lipoate-protein ligase A